MARNGQALERLLQMMHGQPVAAPSRTVAFTPSKRQEYVDSFLAQGVQIMRDTITAIVPPKVRLVPSNNGRVVEKFDEMCLEALEMKEVHLRKAASCKLQKNIHTTISLVAGIILSSVLFGLFVEIAPRGTRWVGASLAFLSAYCALVNLYFRFAEREANHSNAAKRLKVFATSCKLTVAMFQDELINSDVFKALLDQHLQEYRGLVSESPHVTI